MSKHHATRHQPAAPSASSFEWRTPLGPWRWLILGSLGVAPGACGARAGSSDADLNTSNLEGLAGAVSAPPVRSEAPGAAVGGGWSSDNAGAGPTVGVAGTGVGGSAPMPPPTAPSECVFESSLGGGWVRCSNGMVHRPEAGTCSSRLPRAEHDLGTVIGLPEDADAGASYGCRRDSDCTDRAHGHCELGQVGPHCTYGCLTDGDCGAGQVCLCGPDIGECRPAECRTDADCGGSSLCGSYEVEPVCGGTSFACQTSADECAGDLDCGASGYCVREVWYSDDPSEPPRQAPNRTCNMGLCVIGRPFLIDGSERMAPPVVRSDWYSEARPARGVAEASAAVRDAVARGWLEQGLMEHASVAAFARFSLQLLALGAPAELVAAAAAAMQDEVGHARACFELARRHLDADIGPGPLPIEGALEDMDIGSVVLCTLREGCIGETVAALEAAEALAHCEDAAACAVLERIAVEEGRHAELAWRFVAWVLEAHPELSPRVRQAFATELAAGRAHGERARALDQTLARHGLLSASVRAALRERVLAAVVAPCAEALLSRAPGAERSAACGLHETTAAA